MFLTLNNMKNKKIVIVALMSLLLTACGSSGGSTEVVPDDTKTEVKLDVEDLNISNLEDYKLIVGGKEVSATSNELFLKKDEKDVVGLMNKNAQPILFGRKFKGERSVDISIDSSAEMYVLMTPRFLGTNSTNPKELSKRIRSHKDFLELKNELAHEISIGNPCPMNPKCNGYVMDLALDLAYSVKIDDLYEGRE